MAKTTVNRQVTVTLELSEEEAKGLYTLVNFGVHYATAHSLKVVGIAQELDREYGGDIRNPSFKEKATL